ncbi:hypothetical protein HAX54_001238 [Datura stramonium]|uniref:Uncharacterized protein n=1 Tax=Datura stramonium TaxID=4076 RepID=A0ABS8T4B0_DATST|nr:hypothetical protein [Datura stramonium]
MGDKSSKKQELEFYELPFSKKSHQNPMQRTRDGEKIEKSHHFPTPSQQPVIATVAKGRSQATKWLSLKKKGSLKRMGLVNLSLAVAIFLLLFEEILSINKEQSQRVVVVSVRGNKNSSYGSGVSLSTPTGTTPFPVPLKLNLKLRSRACVLGKVVKSESIRLVV